MDLGYATFKRGDRFVEYFYTDRWYNVFTIYDRDDGAHKGWYCNICRPAQISKTAVRCDDLALDVWVDSDGRIVLLDEEEFAALDLSAPERELSHKAIGRIRQMAALGELPL